MSKSPNFEKKRLPSLHAVSRCLQFSEGVFTAVRTSDGATEPVLIRESTVRGTVSNYGSAYGKAKKGNTASTDAANIQTIDCAFLPNGFDRLRLSFSMNVLPVSKERHVCNDIDYVESLLVLVDEYSRKGGFLEIGKLISWRLGSASALWRNRYGVNKKVTVRVSEPRDGLSCQTVQSFEFDADTICLKNPKDFLAAKTNENLSELISQTLAGKRSVLMLLVTMEVTIGDGQEVFPSQDFDNKSGHREKEKAKILYRVYSNTNQPIAGMHSQKINAAIRAIDIWHSSFERVGPLSVEPLGYSHQYQQTFRSRETDGDLYNFLLNVASITSRVKTEKSIPNEAHFVIANLIRGGVFSGEGKNTTALAESTSPTASDKSQSDLGL